MFFTNFPLYLCVLSVLLTVVHSEDNVVLDMKVSDTQDATSSDGTKSAFDIIADVNPETANLMPDNFDRKSSGLFEYDIMLHDWSHEKVFGRDPDRQFGASASFNHLWPNGIVYYTYDDSIASETNGKTLAVIEQAMKVYHENTCVKYVKRTTEEHYIQFHKGSGCWSVIGRMGGKQQISLGYNCEQIGVAVHEMMHALGFWHEQSRPDRDQYVTVLFDNVQDGMKDQFKMYDKGEINSLGSPYDYLSVMHYGDKSFSKDRQNGLKTIHVKDPNYQDKIGQRNGLSPLDIQQIKALYKCAGSTVSAVDGQWGSWSAWSVCDKTCGGGREIRSRSCNNPTPSNGGKTCSGDSVETQRCNYAACPGPVSCDFDQSFCLWENINGDVMDWNRKTGLTASSGTGPTGDHTTGTGSYIFIEASSPRVPQDKAILQSNSLPPATYSRCFKFFYHMYGSGTGQLNIYVKLGNTVSLVWSLQGNQGDAWFEGNIPLQSSTADAKILIEGVRGASYTGDIALDDFSLTPSSYCNIKPINAKTTTDVKTTTTTTTTTSTTTTKVKPDSPLTCDFEASSAACQWSNVDTHDTMNWKINSGPTGSAGTGPSTGSVYAYLEGSNPAVEGDKAWLLSPNVREVTPRSPLCFTFHYSMYGDGIGELNVYFYNPVTTTIDKYWSMKGNQGDQWFKGNVQVPAGYQQNIIIEAVRGQSFTSDIAVDNLEVSDRSCVLTPPNAQVLPAVPPTTPPTTTVADGVIKIEVVSEGCGDPVVRQRTVAKQTADATAQSRKRKSLSGWKDWLKNLGKKVIKKVKKKIKDDKTGLYKNIIDNINKRVVAYLTKKLSEFKPKLKAISSADSSQDAAVQIQNDCSLARSSILVNGVEVSQVKPGHNVVAIDGKTGKVIGAKSYNTKDHGFAATSVASDIEKLPDDTIIAVATQDSVLPQFIGETELQKIGAVPPYLPGDQGSWAFIGYKGKRKVDFIKQSSHSKGNGPSKVAATIPYLTGPVNGGGGGTTTTTNTITTITIVQDEVQFTGFNYITVPLDWSNRLNFGDLDYTVSLWFQTSQDGSLFSKIDPSLQTYSDDIKTVYIEGGNLHVKIAHGNGYMLLGTFDDGSWHHLVITVKQATPSDIIKVYIDGVLKLSKLFQSVVDSADTLLNVGRTVENYPGKSYFTGQLKKFIYKTQAINQDEVKTLFTQ